MYQHSALNIVLTDNAVLITDGHFADRFGTVRQQLCAYDQSQYQNVLGDQMSGMLTFHIFADANGHLFHL